MEVYLLFSWIGDAPAAALPYLLAGTAAGVICMRRAKAGFRQLLPRVREVAAAGEVRQMLWLGRLWFIGALLLFPGYLTDIAALGVWLLTRGSSAGEDAPPPPSAGGREPMVEARARPLDDD